MPSIEKAKEEENEKKCFMSTIRYPETPPTFLFLPMPENKNRK